jgi:WD40 repeat protein
VNTNEKKYDAFLSHNSQDKPAVEQIARWLRDEAKLTVWLDDWNLMPGDSWQKEMQNAIDQSRCCVVFLGPNGIGNWQDEEICGAINKRVAHKSIRIVPVLLPTVHRSEKESEFPMFLQNLLWVKFRNNVNEEDALKRLVCGIKGEEPGHADKNRWVNICPFRGLEIFREQDEPFFCGRDHLIQQLLDYLERHRLLAVIGPSGSGKSSIIQAGLIPALKNSYINNKGDSDIILPVSIATFTPKEHPLEELAFAIQRLGDTAMHLPAEALIKRLEEHEKSLHYIAREISKGADDRLILLVIDQFEELFTQTVNDNERKQFLALIVAAVEATNSPLKLKIILTMRSDFLGKCALYHNFNSFVIDNLKQIGPLEQKDLQLAIEIPADRAGLEFEVGLVSRILKDSGGAPGELPLIEHALLELYERRNGNQLTQKAYEEIGGIEGALTKRAEAEFIQMSPQKQEILRKMFVLRLIQPGEGTEDTRRRATKEELLATGGDAELAGQIIQRWTDARLLSTATDAQRKTEIIDVAHEALIRKWPRVQEWLKDERQNTRFIGQLRQTAGDWRQNDKSPDYLFRGAMLVKAEEFIKQYAGDLTETEREFIQAGISLREEQQQQALIADKELAAARENSNKRLRVIAIIVITGLLAVSFLSFGLNSALKKSHSQLVNNYWENGRQAGASGNSLLALDFMAIAIKEAREKDLASAVAQDVVAWLPQWRVTKVFAHSAKVIGAIFSKDERRILSWSEDNTARLWDAYTGRQIGSNLKHDGSVLGAVFSKDETRILTWSSDKTARLWDASTGRQIGPSLTHRGFVFGAVFSKDETRILTWSRDARLWDASTGRRIGLSFTHKDYVYGAVFSKDETRILTWSADHTARLWDASTGRQIGPSLTHSGSVEGAVFSKDERRILTWSLDNTARLWDASTGRQIGPSLTHGGVVRGAVFSRDETKILTWSEDNTARLWDASTGKQVGPSLSHEGFVNGAVFSKDERRISTWSDDNTARLWDASTGRQIGPSLTHRGFVLGAVFSKDETRILTWSSDKTARLWDASTGRQIGHSLMHEDYVRGAVFSKDERRILTWSDDNTARLWDASTGRRIGLSFTHKDYVCGAVFSNETRILTWSSDNTVRQWDASTGRQIGPSLTHEGFVFGAVFSKDETRILTWSEDKTARLWDASTGQQIGPSLTHEEFVYGAVFSKDEKRILTRSGDKTTRLWDASTGKQIGPSLTHSGSVEGAVFSKNETKILTWCRNTIVRLWGASTGKQFGSSLTYRGFVNGAVFSKDETRILTWSSDNTARLWDTSMGRQIGPSLTHSGSVEGAVFSKDETRILTWSNDNTARLWDASTGRQIGPSLTHEGFVNGAVFSKDETRILTWSFDKTARLWDVPGDLDYPHDKFVLQVEALTGSRFNPDTRQITVIPLDEFYKIQKEYISFAREHAKTCKYKRQNVYLQFFPDGK